MEQKLENFQSLRQCNCLPQEANARRVNEPLCMIILICLSINWQRWAHTAFLIFTLETKLV